MSFEINGKLHKAYPTEQKTASFKAREFVILISEENYPQYIKFQLTQDRCDLLDQYNEGDQIKVFFDLRGREWTNPQGEQVYFTNLNAWRISNADDASNGTSPASESAPASPFPNAEDAPEVADFDDLPF